MPYKGIVIEIGIRKQLRTTSNSFWLNCFFSLNIAFNCVNALLHSLKYGHQIITDCQYQKDSISLLSIWSFSWIIFLADFVEVLNGVYLGSLSCHYFWTNFLPIRIHFLMFQAMCLYLWMQLKLYCHLQNCKYQNYFIPLVSH